MRATLCKCVSLAATTAWLAFGSAFAADVVPIDANSLVFEQSDKEIMWLKDMQELTQGCRPAYVAVVPLNDSQVFFWKEWPTPDLEGLLRSRQISNEQDVFLQAWWRTRETRGRQRFPSGMFVDADQVQGMPRQVLLYAMTPDDAKKTAQAYVDLANERFASYVSNARGSIQGAMARAAERKKMLGEVEALLATGPAELEELKRRVTYHDANQALEVMPDLDKAIHACTIEIAGIRTKLDAIRKYQQPGSAPLSVKHSLETMFIEESIALEAAEARLKTAAELRARAQRYVDLTQRLRSAPKEQDALQRFLQGRQEQADKQERKLAEMLPPAIPGGKVFIQKVRCE